MRPPASLRITSYWLLRRHREAAFRAAELAVERDHVVLGIPGVVDDDRARLGVVVRPVEPADLHRKPVFAVIIIAGDIGPVRGRVGPEVVREALDEARMVGVGAAAVGDAGGSRRCRQQIDDVEARLARGLREIDDADGVARRRPGACRARPWRGRTTADRSRRARGATAGARGAVGSGASGSGPCGRLERAGSTCELADERQDRSGRPHGAKTQHLPPIQ